MDQDDIMAGEHTTPKIGDIWYRVDGDWIDDGSELYVGVELAWTTWRVVKLTRRGAWLQCVEWPYKKRRFALMPGVVWCGRDKVSALYSLVARKRRQLRILDVQITTARDTLELAEGAIAKATRGQS